MSVDRPFIRNVELLIGPLTEAQGGGPTSQALQVLSDGSRDTLRVSFEVKKTLMSAPNPSTIKIYNLSPNSRARIRTSLSRVRLSAGWQNTGVGVIAQGSMLSAETRKEGADNVLTLGVLDGYGGQIYGMANDSFAGAQPVSEVLSTLVGKMPGVQVGRIDVEGRLGVRGRVFSGRASDELDKLARQYGFSWSIQDGVFQALQDQKVFSKVHLLSYRNRNLIEATPILSGPMQQQTGVQISAILDPRVSVGDQVEVESQVNPQLNGRYKVHELSYSGDTGDQTWLMAISSYKVL